MMFMTTHSSGAAQISSDGTIEKARCFVILSEAKNRALVRKTNWGFFGARKEGVPPVHFPLPCTPLSVGEGTGVRVQGCQQNVGSPVLLTYLSTFFEQYHRTFRSSEIVEHLFEMLVFIDADRIIGQRYAR